jgi:hypothetical protein
MVSNNLNDAHDESTPDSAPHFDYHPPALTPHEIARRDRALRRMYHQSKLPPWTKKITWVLFPFYGFMRLHDPNYEEHYQQWSDQQGRAGN